MNSAPPEFIARLMQGLPVEGYTAVTNQINYPLNLDILKILYQLFQPVYY